MAGFDIWSYFTPCLSQFTGKGVLQQSRPVALESILSSIDGSLSSLKSNEGGLKFRERFLSCS